jgi:hypothetical protein
METTMRIVVVTDEGTVIDTIEHVEEYDLDKPLARADLLDEIRQAIRRG